MIKQRPELRDKIYIYGTWGADIIEELKPHEEDIVVRKQRYDGFFGTNLDLHPTIAFVAGVSVPPPRRVSRERGAEGRSHMPPDAPLAATSGAIGRPPRGV